MYTELKMSNFLCPHDEITIEVAKVVAKIQCHMVETVKINFKQELLTKLIRESCKTNECNQSHLLYCPALIGSNQLITYIPDYEDIFNDQNVEEQCFIAKIMMANLKRKKEIEK